jgi:hypothetical protein
VDFTDLERKVHDFREQVEVAVTEITTAIVKLNNAAGGASEGAIEPIITTNSNLFT